MEFLLRRSLETLNHECITLPEQRQKAKTVSASVGISSYILVYGIEAAERKAPLNNKERYKGRDLNWRIERW